MTTIAPPLHLEDITLAFTSSGPTVMITDGLSMTVAAGELWCVAGRSGSGKTSVLRIATGELAPTSGTVRWAGRALDSLAGRALDRERARTVGYLDQAGSLLDHLTALENVLLPTIAMPGPSRRDAEARAGSLLDELGLTDSAQARPSALSGGEQQRIALARALIANAPLLVLDEPTTGLDRTTADEVIDLLLREVSRGAAVLVSSHDPHLVDRADHVVHVEAVRVSDPGCS